MVFAKTIAKNDQKIENREIPQTGEIRSEQPPSKAAE
jgi:hypothetical protein